MRDRIWLRGAAWGLVLLLVPTVRAADDNAIRQAVDKGVTALKRLQRADGTWPYTEIGATSLAGLTLLECDIPPDDPAVRKAADAVRQASLTATQTYSLALNILFLDRLGDPGDVPLIESLAVRLLAGQDPRNGGWGYQCPPLGAAEVTRLANILRQHRDLVASKEQPKPGHRRDVRDLPAAIQGQLEQISKAQAVAGVGIAPQNDNSNTQFAILGLWVARRQGIPVDAALRRVDARFRASQRQDGGWPYLFADAGSLMQPGQSTPAMTCAGLLGLALGFGNAHEATLRTSLQPAGEEREHAVLDPDKDRVIKAGLAALGSTIGNGGGGGQLQPIILLNSTNNGKGYYFLWSVERVAVAYSLDTIGGKDWYDWGSDIILRNQAQDGAWHGEFDLMGADTCFALLFLRRANLARDLTATLKGKVQDTSELKAGGGSGEDLLKGRPGLKPAFETGGHATTEAPSPTRVHEGEPTELSPARLSEELLRAPESRQEQVLNKLQNSKGTVYTEALATAIPQLSGDLKEKARDALAERLSRMKAATLSDYLENPDTEVRRAAALACAMKDEKTHVPRLITLLKDPEPTVVRAAHASLKSLSGKDFGPAAKASPDEVEQAIAAWKAWWRKQEGS